MQTGLHAFSFVAQRLGIAIGGLVLAVILAYVLIVFAMVVGQAASAFGS
jgi:hypothetical protein